MATTLSVGPTALAQPEGDGGVAYLVYTVTRGGDLAGPTTADFAVTGSGPAPAAAADFQGGAFPAGKLWFGGGESAKQIWVPVLGEATAEADEGFTVALSNPSGASLVAGSATGTILNDDGPAPPGATISLRDFVVVVPEGDGGATPITFTLERTGDLSGPATVQWTLTPGGTPPIETQAPAEADDFTGGVFPSGAVSFAPGQSSAAIVINAVGDAAPEPTATFTVALSNASGAEIGQGSARGLVQNDDGGELRLRGGVAPQAEGQGGTTAFVFTVARSAGTDGETSVEWRVAPSRIAPTDADAADFVGGVFPSGTLTFAAGQTSADIVVPVAGDTADEPDEGFEVNLSNPVNGYIVEARRDPNAYHTAFGAILNDDAVTPPGPGTGTPGDDVFTLSPTATLTITGYDAAGQDALGVPTGAGGFQLAGYAGQPELALVDAAAWWNSIAGAQVVRWTGDLAEVDTVAEVDAVLEAMPGHGGGGRLFVGGAAEGDLGVYYDPDPAARGDASLVAAIENLTDPRSLAPADFQPFG